MIRTDLKTKKDLINYLKKPDDRLVFLVHPERWYDGYFGYSIQFLTDNLVNWVKRFI